ncbi:hypothetical protein SynBMKMC1_01406 [Synechococcus sp. BMK-MC-1]|nr:hypothetical protein SynBMKMC1_01406 [Synechococcus sp. BMK-MC-1]
MVIDDLPRAPLQSSVQPATFSPVRCCGGGLGSVLHLRAE